MILAYPSPWPTTSAAPHYLVSGDKAVYILDRQTSANMQKVGVPLIPFAPVSMNWIIAKLDPEVEHPLAAYEPDPLPQPVYDGGFPNTPYFTTVTDGDDPDDDDGFTGQVDGGGVSG